MVGFQGSLDTLVFPDDTSVTWSQTDHHGEPALVATYDSGQSSLTLIGLTMADVAHVPVLFGG